MATLRNLPVSRVSRLDSGLCTAVVSGLLLGAPAGCGDDGATPATGTSSGAASSSSGGVGDASASGTGPTSTGSSGADTTTGEPDGPWQPGDVYPTPRGPNARGWLERRGLVHAHSVYSHDACDGEPNDGQGNINAECYEDLRRDMCLTLHDFMMLTDHSESFASTEFPTNMLYDEARGDVLVDRDGPVANWAACGDDRALLVLAGAESGLMPVGLERHVPGGDAVYGVRTPEAAEILQDNGAVVLLAHPEDFTIEELETLPIEGFEMYNLHANTLLAILAVADLLNKLHEDDPGLPHPDLAIFPLWSEDPRYLERWGTVLAHGGRPISTMGTDSHRNTFPQLLGDGERIDSFRRMQKWFSNHLLVAPNGDGGFDDLGLKEALRARRVFGVFEYLGYPEGFDARIETPDAILEIGDSVPLPSNPEIVVVPPTVMNLDPAVDAPIITAHVLRAIEGGFEEVATSEDELRYVPDAPGAYRVEIRITARHLLGYLGDYAPMAETPRVWIYANPFYVDP